MVGISWLTRGALPLLTALAAIPALALPATARGSAPEPAARTTASPGRAAEWWLTTLNARQAWDSAPERGAGITVAVLSTGVDATHRDLTGNVNGGPDYTGAGRSQGGPFWGSQGTAVASLIAGHGHSGHGHSGHGQGGTAGTQGITGIAPRARILSVRVTIEHDDPLSGDAGVTRHLPDAIARGIRYAVSHGARVIALPLDPATLAPSGTRSPAAGGSAAERAAIRDALARDVILVAPAGDTVPAGDGALAGNGAQSGGAAPASAGATSGGRPDYPAAYPGVIAVGATGGDGKLARFSETRPYVALTAPGSGLAVASPDGKYATASSTVLASALAAGVAALARSRYPGLTATQITQAMEHGAVPVSPPKPGAGSGALSAAGAVTAAASTFSLIGNPMPDPVPAWNDYVASRGGNKTGNSSVLTEATAGAGALAVVLALALVFVRRRHRSSRGTPDQPAPELPGPAAADSGTADSGTVSSGTADSGTVSRRASATDALLRRRRGGP